MAGSGPPSISAMGYASNDPRRGSALYGRHEDAFARQQQQQYVKLPNSCHMLGLPMALLGKDLLSLRTDRISGLPRDLHRP
jgi:hypothetical protein